MAFYFFYVSGLRIYKFIYLCPHQNISITMRLSETVQQAQDLKQQGLEVAKKAIIAGTFTSMRYTQFERSTIEPIVEVVCNLIKLNNPESFEAQIAETVSRYKKCSEKQAYFLARGLMNCETFDTDKLVELLCA